jgi:hypothetical protein
MKPPTIQIASLLTNETQFVGGIERSDIAMCCGENYFAMSFLNASHSAALPGYRNTSDSG